MNKRLLLLLFCASLLSSCTSKTRSLITGAAVGAVVGTVFGAAAKHTNKQRNAMTGAAVGAGLGAWAGHHTHGRLEERDKLTRRDVLLNLENFGTNWNGGGRECTTQQ